MAEDDQRSQFTAAENDDMQYTQEDAHAVAQVGQLGGAEPTPSLLGAPPDRPWPLHPHLRIYVFT